MATATAHILNEPISIREENGSIVEAVTAALITDISGANVTARFQNAYQALDSAGYTTFSSTATYTALRLVQRDIQFDANNTTRATATLTYKTIGLGLPVPGVFQARLSSSLQQIETSYDIYGNEILLSHTYPDDAENFAGETKSVIVNVPQLFPQAVLIYNGLGYENAPLALQQTYIGRKNSTFWHSGEPGTWLCVDITADPVDMSNISGSGLLWNWQFQFQYDPSGWDPLAIFLDPLTNKPPSGLVDGVGKVNVEVQPWADFNGLFPG